MIEPEIHPDQQDRNSGIDSRYDRYHVADSVPDEEDDDEDEQENPELDGEDQLSPQQVHLHSLHSQWAARAQELLPILIRDRDMLRRKREALSPGPEQQSIDVILEKIEEAIGMVRYGQKVPAGPSSDGQGPTEENSQTPQPEEGTDGR